jgi:hypothetical protein
MQGELKITSVQGSGTSFEVILLHHCKEKSRRKMFEWLELNIPYVY